MPCGRLAQVLTRRYPKHSLLIRIDVDEQADYAVLAAVLGGIREAGIEKTLFVEHAKRSAP